MNNKIKDEKTSKEYTFKPTEIKQIKKTSKIVEIQIKQETDKENKKVTNLKDKKGIEKSVKKISSNNKIEKDTKKSNKITNKIANKLPNEEKKSSIREIGADKTDNKQRLNLKKEESKKRSLSHSPLRPTDQLKTVDRQTSNKNLVESNKNLATKTSQKTLSITKNSTKSVTGLNVLKATNSKPIKTVANRK